VQCQLSNLAGWRKHLNLWTLPPLLPLLLLLLLLLCLLLPLLPQYCS
jgi:hypothetical protein